jgi:hypothetical protein
MRARIEGLQRDADAARGRAGGLVRQLAVAGLARRAGDGGAAGASGDGLPDAGVFELQELLATQGREIPALRAHAVALEAEVDMLRAQLIETAAAAQAAREAAAHQTGLSQALALQGAAMERELAGAREGEAALLRALQDLHGQMAAAQGAAAEPPSLRLQMQLQAQGEADGQAGIGSGDGDGASSSSAAGAARTPIEEDSAGAGSAAAPARPSPGTSNADRATSRPTAPFTVLPPPPFPAPELFGSTDGQTTQRRLGPVFLSAATAVSPVAAALHTPQAVPAYGAPQALPSSSRSPGVASLQSLRARAASPSRSHESPTGRQYNNTNSGATDATGPASGGIDMGSGSGSPRSEQRAHALAQVQALLAAAGLSVVGAPPLLPQPAMVAPWPVASVQQGSASPHNVGASAPHVPPLPLGQLLSPTYRAYATETINDGAGGVATLASPHGSPHHSHAVASVAAAPASARAAPPPERPRLSGGLFPAVGTALSFDSLRSDMGSSARPQAAASYSTMASSVDETGQLRVGGEAASTSGIASFRGAPQHSRAAVASEGLAAAWLAANAAAGSPRSASPLLRRSGSPARGGGGALRPASGTHAIASARAHQRLDSHAAAVAAVVPGVLGAAASATQALLLPGSTRPATPLGAAAGGRAAGAAATAPASPFASAMRERAKQHSLPGRRVPGGGPGVGSGRSSAR